MEVRKTIVIGLGSTGTEVCRKVTERIDWEVGGWTRASWCRFVCLETNASQRRPLDAAFRFIPLRIEATEYERVLRNYQDYDARLGLKTWADIDTLQRLDSREVSAGAGNIRMVGRLAFLWERNLVQVKQVLTSELSTLRALSEAEAAERIGTLPDGTQPNIRFVQNGVIRVIVVGTLCGGTCSGLAADFGYFLRSILTEDEKCIAIFTLPHPQRSRAIEPLADRHKRNAYTALVELNHYSLLHLPRPEETYPDGTPVNNRGLPWDLIFLVAPRDADNESLERLNQAVADRIFLNVFVPLADPFSRAVDATMAEDEVAGGMHRARVFSTFGLSSLEFPAAQVLDACAKRLLCHALSEWNNRTLEDRERDQILDTVGLHWEGVREALLRDQHGGSLAHRIDQEIDQIVSEAARSPKQATQKLQRLRAAFQGHSLTSAHDEGGLQPGEVLAHMRQRRREAAEGLANALKQWIADHILEYHRGPLHCLNLVNASIERVHRLLQVQPPDFHPEAGRVDNLLAELAAVWADPVLRLTGLFRAAMKPYLEELRTALRYEVNTRLDACVVEAMNPEQADPGLGERLEQLLKVVQLRIRNLMNRVAGTVDALRREYQDRSRRAPIINGICLFDPETTSGGTVPEEYRYGLRAAAGDPALDEQRAQEREAPKLIAEWNTIPQAVTTTGRSWLDQEWDGAKSSEPPLPADDLSGLLSRARRPFKHLREKANCLERWAVRKDREAEAREVARRARPFLTVDQQLDKSNKPIASSRLTLLPENAAYASSFKDAITSEWPEAGESTLPDQVRVVLLNEFYKFPLSVVPEVLGPYGLCQARSEDFPTFHSRTDIRWSGLSDEEVRAAEEAEKLVVIGVLTGVLRPLEGKLVHERQGAAPLGQSARVELPMDFYGAVHELARSDDAKRAVRNAVGLVLQRMSGSSRSEKCVQFIRHIDQMHRQGEGRYIANWPEDNKLAGIVFRYYANDEELRRASRQVYPPDEAQIAELWKEKGAPLPGGRHAPKDGYYCTTCGGPIGETSEEAEQNGWTCQWNEDHYFGPLRLS